MHKHIFTLGLILTSIYTTTAMAWPTKTATDVWTNSGHTTLATMRCDNCCKTNCWLPSGTTYYDNKGTFTTSCSGEPAEPTCDPNRTYSVVSGQCKVGACVSGTYEMQGFSSCVNPAANATASGYINHNGSSSNASTYGLTSSGSWGATFSYGIVKGVASCNNTRGTYAQSTSSNFTSSSTGVYCWCKMTEPAVSLWVYYDDYGDVGESVSESYCKLACVMDCLADFTSISSNFRSSIFSSVSN